MYLVVYNPDSPTNKVMFHNYISKSLFPKYISDWWHYFDTSYLIISSLNTNELYNIISPGIPKQFLLIIEVQPVSCQGWLPANAWKWLEKYQPGRHF